MAEAPQALVRRRLDLAARVVVDLGRREPIAGALVVGSTALRRCSDRADLDVVLVTPEPPAAGRFTSHPVGGVAVEVERLGRAEALARTEGTGWVWELREAARIGCAVPVHDPDGLAPLLSRRAAAMRPDRQQVEATLRRVYLALTELGRADGPPADRADRLRGCLDNLALLALLEHPRRYQKAKWVLADLLHAGEDRVAAALLAAYGVGADDPGAAAAALSGAHAVVTAAFDQSRLPTHREVLARGHAPDLAEASYVSRALDDADDLAAAGRALEAQYVAKFAARLALGLLGGAAGAPGVNAAYHRLFGPTDAPDLPGLLEVALDEADARRRAFEAEPAARPA